MKPAAFISILAHAGVVAWMFSSFAEPPSPAPGGAAGFSVSFGGPGAAAPMEAAPAGATPAEAVPVPDAPAVEPVEAAGTAEPVETVEPAEPEEEVEVAEAVTPEPEPVEPEVAEAEPVPQEIETVEAIEPPPSSPEPEPPEAPMPRAKPTPPPAPAQPVVQARPEPERREEPRAVARAEPVTPSAPAAAPSDALADKPGAGSGPSETVAAASAGTGGTAAEGPADGRTEDQKAAYFARLSAWLERHKKYPDRARTRRQEGRVMLRFVVDRGGRVLDHRIVRSSGHPVLDREVEAMIARAQPLPAMPSAMPDGQVELVVPVDFALR